MVRQRGRKRLRAEIEIEEQDEEEIHPTKHRRLSVQEPQLSATNGQFEFPGKFSNLIINAIFLAANSIKFSVNHCIICGITISLSRKYEKKVECALCRESAHIRMKQITLTCSLYFLALCPGTLPR